MRTETHLDALDYMLMKNRPTCTQQNLNSKLIESLHMCVIMCYLNALQS